MASPMTVKRLPVTTLHSSGSWPSQLLYASHVLAAAALAAWLADAAAPAAPVATAVAAAGRSRWGYAAEAAAHALVVAENSGCGPDTGMCPDW